MDEETTTTPAPPKGKKGSGLQGKIGGVPKPVVLIVGGLIVYYLYTKYKAGQSSTSSTATPAASSGTPVDSTGSSGGYVGTGGGYGSTVPTGIDPTTGQPYLTTGAATAAGATGTGSSVSPQSSPTDTSQFTPAPPTTAQNSSVTPVGKKTLTVGGKSFATTANFTQNGTTYYGISNPTEAKALEAQGVSLIRNPNDPNGKGLFAVVKPGAKTPVLKAKA